jgi:hypothetical protein
MYNLFVSTKDTQIGSKIPLRKIDHLVAKRKQKCTQVMGLGLKNGIRVQEPSL